MITYSNSEVEVTDGFADKPITKARIVITSVSPNATVSMWVPDYEQKRFRRRDRLTKAKIKELRDGMIEVIGISEMLVRDVRVDPKSAEVRWMIKPKNCEGCR
jgi:hypothetical protein